jgi:uncharacterized protein (TIGR02722 family)
MLFMALAGCTTTKVSRLSVDAVQDLSGRWNDTDSRLVSEQMVGALTRAAWVEDFASSQKRKPVVIVGTVRNLTSEHIETETFIKDIERELINGGRVKFVANSQERGEVRGERRDQQSNATEASAKRLAAETGADFMLRGSLKTQVDSVEGKQVKYYQVDLELVNIENNEKTWLDTKKIKKLVQQSRLKL